MVLFNFRPPESRTYRLDIQIFGRPIRDSPFVLTVSNHHSPVWQFGSYGVDQSHLCQPVKVCCGGIGGEQLYILDTGNNRGKLSAFKVILPIVTKFAYCTFWGKLTEYQMQAVDFSFSNIMSITI